MCKLHSCTPKDPCHYCKRQAEKAKPKPLKRTPIKRSQKKIRSRSPKRAAQEREYRKVRAEYLKAHPICECGRKDENGNVCNRPATDIHHTQGRIGLLLVDTTMFKALARECHIWVELHPKEAKELQLSKNRVK